MSSLLEARKDSKRTRILEAAKRRFGRFGIKGTTMQDIAGEAEIAVGTIYQFFPDKDALILAWVDEHRQLLQAQMAAVLEEPLPAEEKLCKFLRVRFATVEAMREVPAVAELTRAVLRLTPETITEMTGKVRRYLGDILEEGLRSGRLPSVNPKEDAEILFLALSGFFAGTPDRVQAPPTEANMLRVADWFISKWKLPRPKSQS